MWGRAGLFGAGLLFKGIHTGRVLGLGLGVSITKH